MANRKRYRSEWSRDNGLLIWLPVIVVLAGIGAGVYYLWPYGDPLPDRTAEREEPSTAPEQPPAERKPPEPQYPLPDSVPVPDETDPAAVAPDATEAGESGPESSPASEPEPLPALAESDGPLRELLDGVIASKRFEELFVPESLIRHFVVTVDNMTRAKLPQKFSFTRPPPDSFKVEEIDDGRYRIDPANYDRYRPYVVLAESVNPDRLVSIYIRYYPLFQQAYEELGYPDRYFNDRLVEVIDHLLATPGINGPIELVRPKVFYEFADERLEALSAGQKLMIRMGPENAARIKSVLRELRTRITDVQSDRQG